MMTEMEDKYPYPRYQLRRGVLKAVISPLAHILSRFTITGEENIPVDGPLIVVTNHFHFIDAPILILSTPWPLEFLADFEMPNVPQLLKILPDFYSTYDVEQGTPNLDAMRASEAVLRQKGVLGIFPEGRVHQPPLKPALPGTAFLALRTGAPILPVGIYSDNHWDIFGTLKQTGRRIRAYCQFGPVFGPLKSDNPRRPSRAEITAAGVEIMSAIAAQLPEEMRGEFSAK